MTASIEPTVQLRDAGALWLVEGHVHQPPVVQAACDLLAAGASGEGLARLAGHPFDGQVDSLVIEADLRGTLRELGDDLPERDSEESLILALQAMCRRYLGGGLSERELARWAHRTIGHTGPDLAQALVEADDEYDLIPDGLAESTKAELDVLVAADAQRLAELAVREP